MGNTARIAVLCGALCLPVPTSAAEQAVRGMFCDTAEQAEQFVMQTQGGAKRPVKDVMAEINGKAAKGEPPPCGFLGYGPPMLAVIIDGHEDVKKITLPNGVYAIRKVSVVGAIMAGQDGQPQRRNGIYTWYAPVLVQKLEDA